MYSLLRRRTMMTKPSVVPTERLIYQLYDYTCDGTINTFIDTGINLFGYEYDNFRIEMEYDGLDLTQVGPATLLECKSFIGGNFTPGLNIKVSISTLHGRTDAIVTNIYPCVEDNYFQNTSSATVILTYGNNSGSITVNGSTVNGSGSIRRHNEPLTIGGRYSSHLSNPDRFVQFHISSLKIYATPSGIDTTYIYIPLTFKCLTGGDLSIKNSNGSYDRNFEYSLNGGAWTAFDLPKNTASKLIATLSPNDTISFRRDNENFADAQFISDSNLTFDIYGNLLSLQYGSAFNGQTELRNTSKKAFGAIFNGTNVVDASKLMLTAATLSNECYNAMFQSCTYLTHAPEIYATTLGSSCCQRMFYNCTNLICAPSVLYAANLPQFCYQHMFNNCVSLVSAPEIRATNIQGRGAFGDMFNGCTSLITPPNINVVQITNGTIEAFCQMFRDCTSLTTAPELKLTAIYKNMYLRMFYGCSSLTTAPNLPATTLAESCYEAMFSGCTNLIAAPNLPAITLAKYCYHRMFDGCISLISAPELPGTTLAEGCYNSMFSDCTSLVNAPELLAPVLINYCYKEMFKNCSNLSYVKCTTTNWNYYGSITYWLSGVSANGTFVKAAGVNWDSGVSGIPNGWTVIEE